jgi:hypothetical protein
MSRALADVLLPLLTECTCRLLHKNKLYRIYYCVSNPLNIWCRKSNPSAGRIELLTEKFTIKRLTLQLGSN